MNRILRLVSRLLLGTAGAGALVSLLGVAGAAGVPPALSISNVPLVLVQPTDPQVLVIVPNSQSMDGDLGGAIMTGSGQTGISSLTNSASPVYYQIPTGFTPPKDPGTGGYAAYTITSSGIRYDNSASRLNVAKEAIKGVLRQYAASFDFGLMTYQTSNTARYTTWLYYMSGSGGFTFGDHATETPPAGTDWYPNPCYLNLNSYCTSIASIDSGATSEPDVAAATTADAPNINDVLYAGGLSPVCLDYGSHSPATPYPPYRSLTDYNNGNILVGYSNHTGYCASATGPTNAGYVPYSDQVLYAQRGFGFYISSQSATSGNILVGVAPAGSGGEPPTQSELDQYLLKFAPYLQPETDQTGSSYKDIKALAVQSPIAGLINCANKYFGGTASGNCATGGSPPPSNTGCDPNRYVVMVTDGLPTEDLAGKYWPPLGTASADGYGVHATFNLTTGGTVSDTDADFESDVVGGLTTTLASTNDQALSDAIDNLVSLKNTGVKTYVVGMGAGVVPTKNPAAAATMKAMAIAGGTSDYFHGVSPQDVVNDMQIIFALIQAENQSTTTVAVNSTSYQTGEAVFQARFDSSAYHWSGNMVAFPVLSDGSVDVNPADQLWDARSWMNATFAGDGWSTNRYAVTTSGGAGATFRWSNLSSAQQTDLESHWSDLTAGQQAAFGTQAAYGQAVLNYLRGDQSLTVSSGGPFRDRSYLLGDIVNSAPLYVGAPNGSYSGSDYANFVANHANRTPMLYVGSNDGAMHAFNANNGHEMFEFFPDALFSRLSDLSVPSYDANHQFFVDGSPNAADVRDSSGTWHTLLVGGLNDGGAGIYAMEVTDPSQWTSESEVANSILWNVTDQTSGFSDLGLTYSQPQIAEVDLNGSDTFVVVFGSGYNNANRTPDLFVVNAMTGALIREIDLCAQESGQCDTSVTNGLSTSLVLSSTGSVLADRVYAGDLQGNLWRVDLSDPDPANWTARVLFKASTGGTDQPITTQPVASFAPAIAGGGGGVLIFFGTGEYLGDPDVTNTDVQSFYAVLDRGQTANLPMGQSDLNQVTLTDTTTDQGNVVRTASGADNIDWTKDWGWYMDLPDSGERVVTDPRLFAGRVIFTTFVPSTAECSAGGSSWLMAVDYATGGALPTPEFDVNGDSQLNGHDEAIGGGVPAGMSLGAGYAAAPRIVRYRQGQFNDLKLITISGSPVKSVKDHGVPPGQMSWTEIR